MDTMLDSYKDVRSNVALQEYFKTHTGKLNTIWIVMWLSHQDDLLLELF